MKDCPLLVKSLLPHLLPVGLALAEYTKHVYIELVARFFSPSLLKLIEDHRCSARSSTVNS